MTGLYKKLAALTVVPFVFGMHQAHADTQIMDFDTPSMSASVFGGFGQKHIEGDFEHTSVAFITGDPTSHIHGTTLPSGSRASQLHSDAGGSLFRRTDGGDFSLTSWDMEKLVTAITPAGGGGNSDFHVVGLNDGLVVADITLLSSVAGSTIDFISLHAGFGNVDLIEFFFDPAGRGVDHRVPDGRYDLLEAIVDNVTFNDPIPAVPEPGDYAMLLAGLGLVGFAANRRSRHYY